MAKRRPTSSEKKIMSQVRQAALQDPNTRCSCCDELITIENISIDHIQPKCLGYDITKDGNYQVLCKKCNENKGMLSIDYRTKTFIIEPYIFNLPAVNLHNLLVTGDINNNPCPIGKRRIQRIGLDRLRKRLQTKFIVR